MTLQNYYIFLYYTSIYCKFLWFIRKFIGLVSRMESKRGTVVCRTVRMVV